MLTVDRPVVVYRWGGAPASALQAVLLCCVAARAANWFYLRDAALLCTAVSTLMRPGRALRCQSAPANTRLPATRLSALRPRTPMANGPASGERLAGWGTCIAAPPLEPGAHGHRLPLLLAARTMMAAASLVAASTSLCCWRRTGPTTLPWRLRTPTPGPPSASVLLITCRARGPTPYQSARYLSRPPRSA